MAGTEQTERGASAQGNALMAISNAMTRIYKDLFGRGPTKVRAAFAGPDALVVTLEDTLTQAERNMAKLGEHQRLRDVRLFFQHASQEELKRPVEEILGRRVRAFVSGIDTKADVAVEIYVLDAPVEGARGASVELDA